MSPIRVVFIASEAVPFAKTGGLADVAGSLPDALRQLNVDIRVILPGYRQIFEHGLRHDLVCPNLHTWFGSQQLTFQVRKLLVENAAPLYVIDREDMFDRPNLYGNGDGDYYDNAERFIFFCRAVASLIHSWDFTPHVIHCNDWHTGLIPLYMQSEPAFRRFKTLFTVHNMGYSGLFSSDKFMLTGLDSSHYQPNGLEFYGRWSMLKAGLVYSRAVSTVSPTYAQEIQTPEYGKGLEGVLRNRRASVFGLLNGVNYQQWSPETDSLIPARYTPGDLSGKRICKTALIRTCQLDEALMERPVIGIVSRLDIQKGIDLIIPILRELLESLNVGLVILGTGDSALQQRLQQAGEPYAGAFAFIQRFDEEWARRILAGADMLLIPSRYEPCGLTQLYAMKYGTIPVVRATGGLNDTVSEVNERTGEGTGFTFKQANPTDCFSAIKKAVDVYRMPLIWKRIQSNDMSMDFSWGKAAQNYLSLYQELMMDSTI
ncbi:MAG: glycogen synthase GlgA [Deltaproteobacteria bacterium]|jgi:starch synthase